ncbi:Glycosyltransferase involved in cell wall bisynthesis [Novosphingobium sp. CF614]|uniref:glycosyltransferase family 4 protein n=1 Tax=Novosphingobium sp. CF614 TaxID=1884364 RepID=UPI0008DF6449|nr:glycosyltransferase family 4 protein [Novosphingobium sp. CF614]SFF92477.1 Glycosyltransferase involved in cell wall bisynthesis [Novosphingobium sp. CF614]
MRIAYVINSLEGGGAASPVPAIVRVLQGAGAQVRVLVLTRRNGKALPALEAAGVDVSIREGGEKDHLAALLWLQREMRAWRATHLWTSLSRATLLGQVAGARLRLPVVSWQHNAYLKPWNERLLRWGRHRSALWVADSHQVAELTLKRLRIEPERMFTWPIFHGDPNAPLARPWQAGETLRLGSLGRLHPAKGYDVLIGALAQLKRDGFTPPVPFTIAIAGEGAEEARLKNAALAAGVEDWLNWPGFTSDPPGFLAGLHLYLQPSRREGFCIAAHEAMQAALPVIVSATGELPFTVIEGETGLIVPPQDEAALALALHTMLETDPARLAAMGTAGRARVLERFSLARFREAGEAIVTRMKDLPQGKKQDRNTTDE